MNYPEYFTAEDIMEFEFEMNRYIDLADPYSLAAVNAELQTVAEQQQTTGAVDAALLSAL